MKKIICYILTITILFTISSSCVHAAQTYTDKTGRYILGDVDLNGDISILDVTALQLYLAKATSFNRKQLFLADTDILAGLQITDATIMQLFIVNKLSNYPVNADGLQIGDYVDFGNGNSSNLFNGYNFRKIITATAPQKIIFDYWFEYEDKFLWDDGISVDRMDATDDIRVFTSTDDSITTAYVLSENNISANEICDQMFMGLQEVTAIEFFNFSTNKVVSMRDMFADCVNLTKVDISYFDTSRVTNMSAMFFGDEKIENLDVSSFDTSEVTDMSGMFYGCKSLSKLDASQFDTSKVTNFAAMFQSCTSLVDIDVSGFDTSNAVYINYMFSNCKSIRSLDLTNIDTSNVVSMSEMFWYCESLKTVDLSTFNTTNVIYMSGMFYGCIMLEELDLSSFNTANLTSTDRMFMLCDNLKTIYVSDFWDMSNVIKSDDMFRYSGEIVGGNGTKNNMGIIDKTYACIDTENQKGYLTYKAI